LPSQANKKASGKKEEQDKKIIMPDLIELWKEMYFMNEDAWTSATKEFITTQSFVSALDKIKEQLLNYHKISEQNLDNYYKINPVPSKKDIARVAELVIGLEDKVDELDIQFSSNINRITASLIKLVDFQANLKQDIRALRQENQAIQKKLDELTELLGSKPGEAAAVIEETKQLPKAAPRKKTRKKESEGQM